MNSDTSTTLADYITAFRRRFRRMSIVAFSVLFCALLVAYGIPPTYTATATILFESPDVPADIVRSTITAQRDEYINNITKRALRGRNLSPLVEKYHLFDSSDLTMEDRVGRLAGSVEVDPVLEESAKKRRASTSDLTIGFTVAFSYSDPVITKNVTQELAQVFLEENVASRTETARGTAGFLTKDTDRLREEIERTEKAVTDFKAANAQYLPDFKTVMQAQLERSESQVMQLQQSLQASTEREIFLRAQLAQVAPRVVTAATGQDVDPRSRLEDLTAEYVRLSAIYSPEHPDIVRLKRAIQQASTQAGVSTSVMNIADALAAREAELRKAQQTYSPDHPDVVRLSRAVDDLRSQLQRASQQEASQTRANNPAYIQLQAQLDAQGSEKRSIQVQIADLRSRAEDARNRLLRMPEVERATPRLDPGLRFRSWQVQGCIGTPRQSRTGGKPGDGKQRRAPGHSQGSEPCPTALHIRTDCSLCSLVVCLR